MESGDTGDEYIYRQPRWVVALWIALGFAPPMLSIAYVAAEDGPQPLVVIGGAVFLLEACAVAWFLSKIRISIDRQRIRWPMVRYELRWDEVEESTLASFLGVEYVRIRRKNGTVLRITLSRPGGGGFREQLLLRLGLLGPRESPQ